MSVMVLILRSISTRMPTRFYKMLRLRTTVRKYKDILVINMIAVKVLLSGQGAYGCSSTAAV